MVVATKPQSIVGSDQLRINYFHSSCTMATRKGSATFANATNPGTVHDWPKLKDEYMKYKYLTYAEMAEKKGLVYEVVKNYACAGAETWDAERSRIAQDIDKQVRQRLKSFLSESAFKRIEENLGLAGLLKKKAKWSLETKMKVKNADGSETEFEIPFDHDQSIKAISEAVDIEKVLFEALDPKETKDGTTTINMTAIDKLVVVLQGAGGDMKAKLAEALGKKVITQG